MLSITLCPLFDGEFKITLNDSFEEKEFILTAENGVAKKICFFDYESSKSKIVIKIEDDKFFKLVNAPEVGCIPCGGAKKMDYTVTSIWNSASMSYPVIGIVDSILECDLSGLICTLINSPIVKNDIAQLVSYVFKSIGT